MKTQKPPIDAGKMSNDEINRFLELRLFQNDLTAKTDEQIAQAVASFEWQTSEFEYEAMAVAAFRRARNQTKWLWEQRANESWQSPIEQHVKDFRFPPRDLAGTADGMMAVLEAIRSRGMSVGIYSADHFVTKEKWMVEIYVEGEPCISGGVGHASPNTNEVSAFGATPMLAVARAAVAALALMTAEQEMK